MLSFQDYLEYLKYNPLFETVTDDVNESVANYKNSKGIPRDKMPQIKSDDVPEFVKFLKDLGIKSKNEKVEVINLKPTQKEFNPEKVAKLQTAPMNVLTKVIIKSKDNFILDGHHRYSALLVIDPHAKINVISVNVGITELLKRAFEFPKTFTKDINAT